MQLGALRIGSLFAGIGGLELGLEWAGLGAVAWQVESDPWCRRVLARHWPHAERFADVRELRELPAVDLVCGGFPCQDVSSAHSRVTRGGLCGPSSGLWSEFRRVVDELRPAVAVVENVESGVWRWLDAVASDLVDLGYHAEALGVDSRDVGAPHARRRVFVVAYADSEGEPARAVYGALAGVRPHAIDLRPWRHPLPGRLRVADGVPGRMDGRRVRALGNAVVPLCAYVVGLRVREVLARA